MRIIDVTPTWRGTMDMLLLILENGSDESKAFAKKELYRLADAVDRANLETRTAAQLPKE